MKFIAYYRVSTDKQGRSGLGLEAQQEVVDAFTKTRGIEIHKRFTDIKSGSRDDNRPELQKALRECRLTGATLLIAKLDRLSRNARFLLTLQESSVDFVACDMPEANKLTIGLMAQLAEYERELISERTKAAIKAKKTRITASGETWKWGNPNMSEIRNNDTTKATQARQAKSMSHKKDIREVIETIVEAEPCKLSKRSIARKLNEAGYVTAQGKLFSHVQVSRVLAA